MTITDDLAIVRDFVQGAASYEAVEAALDRIEREYADTEVRMGTLDRLRSSYESSWRDARDLLEHRTARLAEAERRLSVARERARDHAEDLREAERRLAKAEDALRRITAAQPDEVWSIAVSALASREQEDHSGHTMTNEREN